MYLSILPPLGSIVWDYCEALRRWSLARGRDGGGQALRLYILILCFLSADTMQPPASCFPAMMDYSPLGLQAKISSLTLKLLVSGYFITVTEKQLRHS